jgi:hypothetical protein
VANTLTNLSFRGHPSLSTDPGGKSHTPAVN